MAVWTNTHYYTGNIVEWYVPNHTPGTLRVTCSGADGTRGGPTPDGRAGRGGSVRGYLNVAPGTKLYLIVGADGTNLSPPSFMAKGGQKIGGTYTLRGGCATEVWDGPTNADRIMVAGGGGTGGSGSSGGSGRGYDGGLGIADGESQGTGYAYGGTLSAPGGVGAVWGNSWATPATAGSGGDGGNGGTPAGFPVYSGAGGGGYYGGGGGGLVSSTGIGGGGGSSWCDTGLFSSVDHIGRTGAARIIVTWDGDEFWVPGGIYRDGRVHLS